MATARKQTPSGVGPYQVQPAPVVLLVGSEDLLADRAWQTVLARARQTDPDVEVTELSGATYEPDTLALVTSPSLFGEGKIIHATAVEEANDVFVEDVRRYLGQASPAHEEGGAAVTLVLRHGGGNRHKGLLDLARGVTPQVVECQPVKKDQDKHDFVVAEMRRAGRKASFAAVRALVESVGSDLRELASSCAQLVADTEGTIDVEHVTRYHGGRVEVSGFRVADEAVAGNSAQALVLLRHALATGLDPVPMVAALAVKLRALAKVSAAGRGRSADLAGQLGLAPWQVDRARRELAGWSPDGLARAIAVVAEADAMVKGGGRDPDYAVERAVLAVAAAHN